MVGGRDGRRRARRAPSRGRRARRSRGGTRRSGCRRPRPCSRRRRGRWRRSRARRRATAGRARRRTRSRPETSRNGRVELLAAAHDPHRAALLDHEHAAAVAGRRGHVDRARRSVPIRLQAQARAGDVAVGVPVAVAVAVVGDGVAGRAPWRGRPPPPQPSASSAAAAMSTRTPLTSFKDDRRGARARRSPAPRLSCPASSNATGTRNLRNENLRSAAHETLEQVLELARRVARQAGVHRRGCTIVLDGAVSQWKRSDGGSAAIGPPSGVAGRDALERRAAARARRRARSRARARPAPPRRARVRAPRKPQRAAEQHDAGVEASPRSTRGTTRTIAYWKSSRAGTLGLLHPLARRLEPRAPGARRTARRRPTPAGTSAAARAGSASGASRASASAIEPGRGQQHVVADRRERPPRDAPAGRRRRGARRARRRGRSATGCRASAAGSGCAACGRRSSTSASSQTTSAASSGVRRLGRRVGQRAGQEVDAEVEPGAGRDQVLDLRVGLGARRAPGRARRARARAPAARAPRASSPATISAASAFGPWPGAAELEHVQAVVVGLDDARQRAALAQRGHVAGGGHRAQHGWHDG